MIQTRIQGTVSPGVRVTQYPLQKHLLCCIINHCNACRFVSTSSMTAAHLVHLLHLPPPTPPSPALTFTGSGATEMCFPALFFLGLTSQAFRKQSIVLPFPFLVLTLISSSSTSSISKSAKNSFAGSISSRTPARRPSFLNNSTMTDLNASGKGPPKSILISCALRVEEDEFGFCWGCVVE